MDLSLAAFAQLVAQREILSHAILHHAVESELVHA